MNESLRDVKVESVSAECNEDGKVIMIEFVNGWMLTIAACFIGITM